MSNEDDLDAGPVSYAQFYTKQKHGSYGVVIPWFQRNYAWQPRHVRKFIASINDADTGLYVGNILVRNSLGTDPDIVIDGQQRLVTLSLLLLELRRHLPVEEKSINKILFSADANSPRVIFSRSNLKGVYEKILAGMTLDEIELDESTKRISKNFEEIQKELKLIKDKDLFFQKVCAVTFVVIKIPNSYNASSLFEGLNATNKPLTTVELTKNSLFGNVRGDTSLLEEVNQVWEEIESAFEAVNNTWFDSFLRYRSFTEYHHVTNQLLFEKISKDLRNCTAEEILRFVQNLEEDADIFLRLRNGQSVVGDGVVMGSMSTDARAGLARLVQGVRSLGFPQIYIVLLALYKYGNKNPKYFTKDTLFRDVKAAFSFVVLAKYTQVIPSRYEKLFANFAGDIHNLKQGQTPGSLKSVFFKKLQGLIPESTDKEFATALLKDIYCTGKTVKRPTSRNDRDFLGSLLRLLEGDDLSVSGTIEHVIPKSDEWRQSWKHVVPEFQEQLRFRLGNLTLLEDKLNKVAGSETLEDKILQYNLSGFEMTKQLSRKNGRYYKGFSSGDPASVIEERGEKMACELFQKLRSEILNYGK